MPETDYGLPLIDNLFIGAGAMKAGTTWLYSVLGQHPDIYFSPEKEIHYFYAVHVRPDVLSDANRLQNVQTKYLRFDPTKGRTRVVRDRLRWAANYLDSPIDDHWYRQLFALRRDQKWAADFSNLYAHLPSAAWARIAEQVDQLRVIYTLRDPVDRLWSHAKFHLRLTGQEDSIDRWDRREMNRFLRQPFIWENAEYGAAIRRMQEGLPESSLKIAWHEGIHSDPRAFLSEMEVFLGLPAHDYPEGMLKQRVNSTPARSAPTYFRSLVAQDVERIEGELRALNLSPPDSWSERVEAAE
ncbi:MAG: sulfotransferase [Pseudomonadota bacterium]